MAIVHKDLRGNITQQAFVEFSKKCSPTGLAMKSSGGRMDSPERAVIHFETMGVTHAVTMIYEYGWWYKDPTSCCRPVSARMATSSSRSIKPPATARPSRNASPTARVHQTASLLVGVAAPRAVIAVGH